MLKLRGTTENLEDFMARIDTPLLDHLYILLSFSAFDRVVVLDTPHLQFIGRIPKLQAPDEAYLGFDAEEFKIWINFFSSTRISRRVLRLEIFCIEPERQFPLSGPVLSFAPFPPSPIEIPLHRRGSIFATKSAKPHGEYPMVGTSATICYCE